MKRVTAAATIALLIIAAIAFAQGDTKTRRMTDQELKAAIASAASNLHPQQAAPLIAEARKRASERKDTKWMLDIIQTDIELNAGRQWYESRSAENNTSEEENEERLFEKEMESAWTPLRQMLHLQRFMMGTESKRAAHAKAALEEAETLIRIPASDIVETNKRQEHADLNLLEFIVTTIATSDIYDTEEWDDDEYYDDDALPADEQADATDLKKAAKARSEQLLTATPEDLAACDDELTTKMDAIRTLTRAALATGDGDALTLSIGLRAMSIENAQSAESIEALKTLLGLMERQGESDLATSLSGYTRAIITCAEANADGMSVDAANALLDKALQMLHNASEKAGSNSSFIGPIGKAIRNITHQELSIGTDDIIAPNVVTPLYVTARNVDKVRVAVLSMGKRDDVDLKELGYKALTSKYKMVAERVISVPKLRNRLHAVTLYTELAGLEHGVYAIVATADGNDKIDAVATTLCTSIAADQFDAGGKTWIAVNDLETGKPKDGAKVGKATTDKDGWTERNIDKNQSVNISHNGESISIWEYKRYTDSEQPKPRESCRIITDRNIFRPGQTVHFKAYLFTSYADRTEAYEAGEKVTARLFAHNGKELGATTLKTNEFGTVSGSFAIPDDTPKGECTIFINCKQRHSADITVEDFKRTDNSIRFDSFTEAIALGQSVTVGGTCESAAGLPVAGASVTYEIRHGGWHGRWHNRSRKKAIAQGTTTTDGNGRFEFSFESDNADDREDCTYEITVSITDNRGETTVGVTSCTLSKHAVRIDIRQETDNILLGRRHAVTLTSANSNSQPFANTLKLRLTPYESHPALMPMAKESRIDTIIGTSHFAFEGANNANSPHLGNAIWEQTVEVNGTMRLELPELPYDARRYKLTASAVAPDGFALEDEVDFTYIAPQGNSEHLPGIMLLADGDKEAGTDLSITLGSGLPDAHVTLVGYYRGKEVMRGLHDLSKSTKQLTWSIPADAIDGETLMLRALAYKNGRRYETSTEVRLRKTTEPLELKLATWRDLSTPGAKERWQLVTDKGCETEIAASMYDSRLDKYADNRWYAYFSKLGVSNSSTISELTPETPNPRNYGYANIFFHVRYCTNDVKYRTKQALRELIITESLRQTRHERYGGMVFCSAAPNKSARLMSKSMAMEECAFADETAYESADADVLGAPEPTADASAAQPTPPLPRENFAETVFFLPTLTPDAEGNATIEFTLPDNLTSYNFRAVAHDKSMRSATESATLTVRKPLNVRLGAPRFVTEGDTILLTADVTATDSATTAATATMSVTDAETGKAIANLSEIRLTLSDKPSGRAEWKVSIPAGVSRLRVLTSAIGPSHTDAEQIDIPVAAGNIEVPESETFMLTEEGKQTLQNPFTSGTTLTLTFNYSSNTFIEVLRALPYLNREWGKNTDTYLGRFETATIATFLKKKPEIARAVEYIGSHNADLSTVSDSEATPWLILARRMREHDKGVVKLLSGDYSERLAEEALMSLVSMQHRNGAFPWFKGMDDSRYATTGVLRTMGDLVRLGVLDGSDERIAKMCKRGASYLDKCLAEDLAKIERDEAKAKKEGKEPPFAFVDLGAIGARLSVDTRRTEVIEKLLSRLRLSWQGYTNFGRADIAWVMLSIGDKATAAIITQSLEENLVQQDKQTAYVSQGGIFFRQRAQLGAQTMLIELLKRLKPESPNIAKLINYAIKQKRGEAWPDAQTTSRCVLTLLSSQAKLEANDEVTVGGATHKLSIERPKLTTPLPTDGTASKAVIVKDGDSPSWGSWERILLTPTDRMEEHHTEEMRIVRQTTVRRLINGRERWVPLTETELTVGDEVKVTLEFYNKMPLSYVRITDHRAASLEPTELNSGYRGWWFWRWMESDMPTPAHYLEITDKDVQFYIEHLSGGWHRLSYTLRVTHSGSFVGGYAEEECLYDPEIRAHTEGCRIEVK